ncbi:hypothetical protein BHE74_00017519 [Ensete ventricosum]|nr:hypothetical protein GW17_00026814 [Ensete ventricosum]RWW74534.1 hypothetical protein BHE74_00017519 [Ensete ventricosum]
MALMWTAKGGALTRRLTADLGALVSHLKGLGGAETPYKMQLRIGERELSFDETPIFRFRMRRPRFLCITPQADDEDINMASYFARQETRGNGYEDGDEEEEAACGREQEDIDTKAEEFIKRFHRQMQLQRQMSLLQYHEMLLRGLS